MGNKGPLDAVQSGKAQSNGCDSTAYSPLPQTGTEGPLSRADPLNPVRLPIPERGRHALRTILPNGLGGISIGSPALGSRLFATTGR